MSREIRFKFWDKQDKRWDDSGLLYVDDDGRIYEIFEASKSYETYMHRADATDRYERVEYTGLHDNNDREIYEGDILSCDFSFYDSGNNRARETSIGQVIFQQGGFVVRFGFSTIHGREIVSGVKTEWLRDNQRSEWTDFEVIGNIYEHPTLLDQ